LFYEEREGLWFPGYYKEVNGVSEKTTKSGIRGKTGRISSRGNSVKDDVEDHFSVLDELAAKLEEYYAMSTMPTGSRGGYYD